MYYKVIKREVADLLISMYMYFLPFVIHVSRFSNQLLKASKDYGIMIPLSNDIGASFAIDFYLNYILILIIT